MIESKYFKNQKFAIFFLIGHDLLLKNIKNSKNLKKICLRKKPKSDEYRRRSIIYSFFTNYLKTKKIIKKGNYDLVFHAGGTFYTLKIPQISYLRNILILKRPKRALSFFRFLKLKVIEILTKKILKKMNAVICQSKTAQKALRQLNPTIKSELIYNGINVGVKKHLDYHCNNKKRFRILYYSLIAPYKNHGNLLEVISNLDLSNKNITVDFIGPAHFEYLKVLQRKYKKLFETNTVNYLGVIPQNKVFCQVKLYKYALFLSGYESFPNSLFEIVKAGLPVLALKCDVSYEFMPQNPIWVNCNELDELEKKIKIMNSFSQTKLKKINALQSKYLKKLKWETCAQKTIELIKKTTLNEKRILPC